MTEKIQLGRLKKRSEFLYVRDGRYRAIGGVVIQMRENPENDEQIRVGFTATKKVGNAVIRNRAKRRLKACAQSKLPELGLIGHDYVFIARNNTATRKFEALQEDVKKALITLSKPLPPS